MSWQWFNWVNLLILPGLLVGFTIHELGHALMAYYLGDYSQAKAGRISANPLKHFSWFGGLLFILFGFGWPKPVVLNVKNFQHPYLDSYLVAMAGPLANFAATIIIFGLNLALVLLLGVTQQIDSQQVSTILFFNRLSDLARLPGAEAANDVLLWIVIFSNRIWVANFVLGVMSLIPLPPFDGFTAALSLVGAIREKRIRDLTGETDETKAITSTDVPAMSSKDEEASSPPLNKKQDMAAIHFKIGKQYHADGKFDDAIARYRQAVNVNANHGPAYVNMGLAFRAKAQNKEAIHAFRAATRYAADDESKNQAWAALHELSGTSPPSALQAAADTPAMETKSPWTDTKPKPNWLAFGTGLMIFFFIFSCILGSLLLTLIG